MGEVKHCQKCGFRLEQRQELRRLRKLVKDCCDLVCTGLWDDICTDHAEAEGSWCPTCRCREEVKSWAK